MCQQPAVTLSVENKGQKILVLSSALNCQNCREVDGCSLCSTEGVCELRIFKLPFRTQSGLWVLVESVELLSPNGSQCHYLHSASDWSWWWLPRGTFGRHQLPPSVSPALLLTFAATKTQLCGFSFTSWVLKAVAASKRRKLWVQVETPPFSIFWRPLLLSFVVIAVMFADHGRFGKPCESWGWFCTLSTARISTSPALLSHW